MGRLQNKGIEVESTHDKPAYTTVLWDPEMPDDHHKAFAVETTSSIKEMYKLWG